MLSVRFEVGFSLLLTPAGADKRGPEDPFSSSGECRNAVRDSQESTRRSSGGRRVLLKALGRCLAKLQGDFCIVSSFIFFSFP